MQTATLAAVGCSLPMTLIEIAVVGLRWDI
jgi:hypothetical protein